MSNQEDYLDRRYEVYTLYHKICHNMDKIDKLITILQDYPSEITPDEFLKISEFSSKVSRLKDEYYDTFDNL